MKKSMLALILLINIPGAFCQSFSGDWQGTITRDYGNKTITDSIEFYLEQTGDKITGYSMLIKKDGTYIKSLLEGNFQQSNKTLKLTETKIDHTNVPNSKENVFLDRYLLYYDDKENLLLSGKSVAWQPKAIYSRSKMTLRKSP